MMVLALYITVQYIPNMLYLWITGFCLAPVIRADRCLLCFSTVHCHCAGWTGSIVGSHLHSLPLPLSLPSLCLQAT